MAPITLSGHVNADFVNELDRRKSVMGYNFTLDSGAISWASHKQKVVTLSSTEAEYIGASEAAKEACWLRMLLRSISISVNNPTPILCDNDAARILATDQVFHARAKHISNQYHHIRDCIEKKRYPYHTYHPSTMLPTPSPKPSLHPPSSGIAQVSVYAEGVFTSVRGCTAAGPEGVCWSQSLQRYANVVM
jgi:hypothetical protein